MARRKNRETLSLEWPDGKIPVAIYARVSSDKQDVENSIEAQVAQLREWALSYGRIAVREYIDRAKSGRADKRPDFRQMIADSEDPERPFQEILVWRFSRFFRDRVESALYKQKLKKSGVTVTSINEPLDNGPTGKFLEGILESVDGFQSDTIGQDVRRGTHNLAEKGFFLGRLAPYGMMKVPEEDGGKIRYKLAPDPETSPHIRRLFDLGLEDKSEKQITKALNKEGIPAPGGGEWRPNRVHDALTNRHYEGTIVWGLSSVHGPPTITPNAHPGIVTPEEFEKVQQLLRDRAPEVTHPRHAGSEHLLSELGKCRRCGSNYTYATASREGKTYIYLVCATRKAKGPDGCDSPWLPSADFEQKVMNAILEDILTEEHTRRLIDALRAEEGDSHTQETRHLDDIEKRLEGILRRRDKLYMAFENEEISFEKYSARNRELKDLEDRTRAEREQAQAAMGDQAIILENPDAVLEHIGDLNRFLRTEEPLRCRSWLKRFVECIWIEPGRATIRHRIPLPEGSPRAGQTRRQIELGKEVIPSTRSGPPARE
jgi:DNA invertase Pin-like site-specific DNA recombinase